MECRGKCRFQGKYSLGFRALNSKAENLLLIGMRRMRRPATSRRKKTQASFFRQNIFILVSCLRQDAFILCKPVLRGQPKVDNLQSELKWRKKIETLEGDDS